VLGPDHIVSAIDELIANNGLVPLSSVRESVPTDRVVMYVGTGTPADWPITDAAVGSLFTSTDGAGLWHKDSDWDLVGGSDVELPDDLVTQKDLEDALATEIQDRIDGDEHLQDQIDELNQKLEEILNPVFTGNIMIANKSVSWNELPTGDADNGTLEVEDNGDGTYTVKADFVWINPANNALSWLVDVVQFRNNQIGSGKNAFDSFPGQKITALENLDTSNLTDMYGMFNNCKEFNQYLNNLDVSNVTDMSAMFSGTSKFNQPLSKWQTGNVRSMNGMFMGNFTYYQDLRKWCVSKIAKRPTGFGTGMDPDHFWNPPWGQCPEG